MKNILHLLPVLMLALSACANRPTYAETLQPWIGQSEERLQQAWGYPANVFYVTPDEKVVTYIKFGSRAFNGETRPYNSEVAYSAIETPDFGMPQHTALFKLLLQDVVYHPQRNGGQLRF